MNAQGSTVLKEVLYAEECSTIAQWYPEDNRFRSRVVMSRHGFGRREYKYFSYPLPDIIQKLRTGLYAKLVPVANRWNEAMGIETRYPGQHDAFIRRCHEAGQQRPTPLLLQYQPCDYNCLHQDLYGRASVPEAAVDKDCDLGFAKDHVGSAGNIPYGTCTHAEAQPASMRRRAHGQLGTGVPANDCPA